MSEFLDADDLLSLSCDLAAVAKRVQAVVATGHDPGGEPLGLLLDRAVEVSARLRREVDYAQLLAPLDRAAEAE
jgi:hypothetical protein